MKLKLIFMTTILLAMTTVGVSDIANSKLPFTGRLIFNGNPVTTDTEFQFRIYDDPAAGTLLFSKTTMLSPLGLTGTFYDELDTGLSFDRRVWLEVEVNNSDLNTSAILTPRREIGARAFAQQSNITHYTNASARALGDYFPFFDSISDLGKSTNRWKDFFTRNITFSDEIKPQGITCSGDQVIRKNSTGWFCINDTRIASEVFDWDAGTGTITDESGDLLIFEFPNSQTRSVVGNLILPKEMVMTTDPVLTVQYTVVAPVGVTGNARLEMHVKYIAVGELTTKADDQTFIFDQPVTGTLNLLQVFNRTLNSSLMAESDKLSIRLTRIGTDANDTFTGTLAIIELSRFDYVTKRL
jgi:hypothetical protein